MQWKRDGPIAYEVRYITPVDKCVTKGVPRCLGEDAVPGGHMFARSL
jgi:hypothetical protein